MISPTVCADTPARRTRTSAARRTSRIRSGLTPFDLLACRPRRGTWYGPRRPVEGLAAGTLTNLAAALAIVPRHEDREAVGGEQLERADRLEVRRRGATLSG
jgi:hypothetical protein